MNTDNLFRTWQEVNTHIRHWERLLVDNTRTAITAVTASIAAAGLVASSQGFDSIAQRAVIAALLLLAALLAMLGYQQLNSAHSYLERHFKERDRLEAQGDFTLREGLYLGGRAHGSHRFTARGLLSVAMLCAYGSIALLILPSSYYARADAQAPLRVAVEGFSDLTQASSAIAQVQGRQPGASALLVVQGLEDLTRAVQQLQMAQSQQRSASAPNGATGLPDLTRAIDRLSDEVASSRAIATTAATTEGTGGPPPRTLPFNAVAEASNSSTRLVVAGVSIVVALAGLSLAVFRTMSSASRSILASASLAVGITGTLPLTFQGEIHLKGDFSCGSGGCFRIERGSAAPVLRALPSTPSFDIGSAAAGSMVGGCVGPNHANDAAAWDLWRASFRQQWLSRRDPKSTDVVLLWGSADAQPLSTPLRRQHESNAGLALARAELVARMLKDDTAAEPLPRDRLDPTRILTLAAGPAGTGRAAQVASGRSPCDDEARNEKRRVGVWIQAAPR